MQDVSAVQGALFDLFNRIDNFFRRLEVYIGLPPTVEMTDTIMNVMAEVLQILALVTKEIKQGIISEWILDDTAQLQHPSAYSSSERFFKQLIGRSGIEDALRRLDNLTQDEHRMATAQDLAATHHVNERVMSLDNEVKGVGESVQCVNKEVQSVGERVGGVDDRVQSVDDTVKRVDDKMDVVVDGSHLLFVSLYRRLHPDRFCD